MRTPNLIAIALSCATLSACGDSSTPGAGGVTPGEAQALNDAAAMLDDANVAGPVGEVPAAKPEAR